MIRLASLNLLGLVYSDTPPPFLKIPNLMILPIGTQIASFENRQVIDGTIPVVNPFG